MGNRITKLIPNMISTTTDTNDDDLKDLSESTGFTYRQIEEFQQKFDELCAKRSGNLKTISPQILLSIPDFRSNPLKDRIVSVFMSYAKDKNNMDFREFVEVLTIFKPISGLTAQERDEKRKQKLKFVFNIYDIDGNGYTTHIELCEILRKILAKPEFTNEKIEQMAETMMTEMDRDLDKQISFEDYCLSMANDDIDTKLILPFLKTI